MSETSDKTQTTDSETSTEKDKKDYAQFIQSQVAEIKQELLQRIEVLKSQLPLNQDDLSTLKETLKTEVSALFDDVTQVSKEIKQDLTELSVKHKDTISATLQRTKDHTLDAWNKLHGSDKSTETNEEDKS